MSKKHKPKVDPNVLKQFTENEQQDGAESDLLKKLIQETQIEHQKLKEDDEHLTREETAFMSAHVALKCAEIIMHTFQEVFDNDAKYTKEQQYTIANCINGFNEMVFRACKTLGMPVFEAGQSAGQNIKDQN